jgi:hypothetical protein
MKNALSFVSPKTSEINNFPNFTENPKLLDFTRSYSKTYRDTAFVQKIKSLSKIHNT